MELGVSSDAPDQGGEEAPDSGAPESGQPSGESGAGRSRSAHSGGRQAGTVEGPGEEGSSGEGKEAKEAKEPEKPAKPKTRKRKIVHRGEEIDFDPDDDESVEHLAQRLGQPYKVTIGGEERERSLDELLKDAAHVGGANARFQEAAQMKRDHDQWVERMKADPLAIKPYLQNALGVDPYKVLYDEVMENERIESLNRPDPNLSAEENAARQRQYQQIVHERMREEARREVAMQQQRENQQRMRQEQQRRLKEFVAAMPEQFEKHGLTIDPVTGPVSARLKKQMEDGGQEVTPEAVAYQTKRALEGYAARHLPTDPEALLKAIGTERLEALNKYWAKKEKTRLEGKARGEGGERPAASAGNSKKKAAKPRTLADIDWG